VVGDDAALGACEAKVRQAGCGEGERECMMLQAAGGVVAMARRGRK